MDREALVRRGLGETRVERDEAFAVRLLFTPDQGRRELERVGGPQWVRSDQAPGTPDKIADAVVSGINRGPNVADDLAYSGTVAGAREAAMLGVPAIAVSLASKDDQADYAVAAAFATQLVPIVLARPAWSRRMFLNVNVPNATPRGVRITSQGRRDQWMTVRVKSLTPEEQDILRQAASILSRVAGE